MERTNDPVLSVRNLSVSFADAAGTLHAVDDVSFDVPEGGILGVVGESGSGKTVSLMSTMGMIESSTMHVSGSALFRGRDLLKMDFAERAALRGREIGFVFQNPLGSLNPVMRIGAQIAEAPLFHGLINRRQARDCAISLLESVGVANPERRLDDYPHQFSGGERQRVMIAIAISCGPRLLICDEPTTALDVTVERKILELLFSLRDRRNLSIVFITHDLTVAMNFADEISVMYGGAIMERGSALQVLSNPAHPYTRELFSANMEVGKGKRRGEEPAGTPAEFFRGREGCPFEPAGGPPFVSRSRMREVEGEPGHWVNDLHRYTLETDGVVA